MEIKKGSKKINIGKVKKVNWFGKIVGLMFCRRERADSLLFEFKKPTKMKIHSYFVFFPFLVIWLNKDDEILALKKVNPFKINIGIRKSYSKLIEIPINNKNKKTLELLDGDQKDLNILLMFIFYKY